MGLQLSGIEGLMAFENGRSDAGIDGLRAMLTLARQVADPRLLAMTLNNLGYTLHLSGADEEAEGLLREAVKVFGALGHPDAGVMDSLGRVLVARGALGPAAEVLREGLANGLSRFDRTGITQCLEGLAICRQAQGAHRASVLLTSAADALREQTGYALPENERRDAARRRSDLRVRLGEVAFGEAWQFGQTEVLARVLEQAAAVDSPAPL